MRIPESLASLADLGIIEEVVRPLMSGKEAQVYLVVAGGEHRVAKIYKDAQHRTFKHRAEYTEGRKTRNTRDQRAIGKRTTHGRAQDEAAWRVDGGRHALSPAIVRACACRCRTTSSTACSSWSSSPTRTDSRRRGSARSRSTVRRRRRCTTSLLREVVRMLCAGVVHGDLSEFNVLMAADGPVIIDFPQSVDAAHNPNARKLLVRDVDNLHDFVARFVRPAQRRPFAEEMWELYEANGSTPETPLTGRYRASSRAVDTASVLALIDDANRDERRRREYLGIKGGPAEAAAPPRAAAGRGRQLPGQVEGHRVRAAGPAGAVGVSRNDQHGRTEVGANARPDGERPRHGEQRPHARIQQPRRDERSAHSHTPPQSRSPVRAETPASRKNEKPLHGRRPPLPHERPTHGSRSFVQPNDRASHPNDRASHGSRAQPSLRPSPGHTPPSRSHGPPSHAGGQTRAKERPPHKHTAPSRPNAPHTRGQQNVTRASTGDADTRPMQRPDGAPAGTRARRRHRKGPPPTRGF